MIDRDDIWDEFRWEEFMKERDKQVERYLELFYRHQDNLNRDEILRREMGWSWIDPSENVMDAVDSSDEEESDGEEWKTSAGVERLFEDDFGCEAVFLKSREFAERACRIVDDLPEPVREDSAVVDFLANAMITTSKIAGGIGIGEGVDELGGNIAYCKRGLAAANLTIAALHELKEKHIVLGGDYPDLIKEAVEVRNAVAIHILDLREKFSRRVS